MNDGWIQLLPILYWFTLLGKSRTLLICPQHMALTQAEFGFPCSFSSSFWWPFSVAFFLFPFCHRVSPLTPLPINSFWCYWPTIMVNGQPCFVASDQLDYFSTVSALGLQISLNSSLPVCSDPISIWHFLFESRRTVISFYFIFFYNRVSLL